MSKTKKNIRFCFSIKYLRVAELAQTIEFEHKPTLDELLGTVTNRDEVEELVKRPVEFISLINKKCKYYFKKNQIGSSIFW